MKCPPCGYEWKIQRKPGPIRQVVPQPLQLRPEPTYESKEADELSPEKSQPRPTSSLVAAGADEEEIVCFAWLLHWVNEGCGHVGDLNNRRRTDTQLNSI